MPVDRSDTFGEKTHASEDSAILITRYGGLARNALEKINAHDLHDLEVVPQRRIEVDSRNGVLDSVPRSGS
jgi:hypothetical protein